jgi:hypothetical protein
MPFLKAAALEAAAFLLRLEVRCRSRMNLLRD